MSDLAGKSVLITGGGTGLGADMARDHETWVNDRLSAFTEDELTTLITLLDRIGEIHE